MTSTQRNSRNVPLIPAGLCSFGVSETAQNHDTVGLISQESCQSGDFAPASRNGQDPCGENIGALSSNGSFVHPAGVEMDSLHG